MKLLIRFGANARESANQLGVTRPCGRVKATVITWTCVNIYVR